MPTSTSSILKILVIEDEPKLLRSIQRRLEKEGYRVIAAEDGEAGSALAASASPDAVVLDLMLPGRSGLDVLRGLRAAGFSGPVLILTARDTVEDRVQGLDGGADDYLVKPFAFDELLARLRALLRRGKQPPALALRAGELELDLVRRRVVHGGVELNLTGREFEVLEYLLRHRGSTVTREMMARDVWKEPGGVQTNAIDVCINGLRKKLRLAGTRPLIQTVRGVGYAIEEPE